MNWSDEPVRVGDKFLTEKGGVVEVILPSDSLAHIQCRGLHGNGYWKRSFHPAYTDQETARYYGPITGKIKETTMDSKRLDEIEAKAKQILAEVAELRKPPIPELPTKLGAVIESGGVRFARCGLRWYNVETDLSVGTDEIINNARQNGGFKVLLD